MRRTTGKTGVHQQKVEKHQKKEENLIRSEFLLKRRVNIIMEISKCKSKIKYLVMDVDGTLTDSKIYMSNSGELCKAFNIKDGCGIHDIAMAAGIIPVIITGRKSDIVKNRCHELGITSVFQGVSNKEEKLYEITSDFSGVAYIGDDINDLVCMRLVKSEGGIIGCPADAVEKVKEVVDFIAEHNGGEGAVRDFIEWILKPEQQLQKII